MNLKRYAYAIFIISGYVATHAAWSLAGPLAALTVGSAILATVAGAATVNREMYSAEDGAGRARTGSAGARAGKG